MSAWPWPNDTHEDRLKRIIDSYRTALLEADPVACKHLDARMAEFGQKWISREAAVAVNEVKSATEIASQFGLAPWDIQNWHRRHPDKIPVRGRDGGRNLYRVGDVLAYQVYRGR